MPQTRGIEGFPPITTDNARVLILGSMPGEMSLTAGQYYAHPRNSFWKVMAALFEMPIDTYAQRVALIQNNALALWDTLQACERPGSLDSSIVKDSIIVNDFEAFFAQHTKITHVFWNGGTAAAEFKKHAMPRLSTATLERLSFTQLVSTSPTMAGKNFQQKLQEWQAVKEAINISSAPVSRTSRAKGG